MAKARHPETRDVSPKALLLFGVGLLFFLALAAIALKLIFNTTPYWPLLGAATNKNETDPVLQTLPSSDLAAFRKQEDADLNKLGWVDRDAGIARIPIDDAMGLIAAQGLPDWSRHVASADQNCALLEAQVPRAPQIRKCRTGSQTSGSQARPRGDVAPARGARP